MFIKKCKMALMRILRKIYMKILMNLKKWHKQKKFF